MSKARLKNLLLEQGFSVEDINTNNGWGFGGWFGKRYTKGEHSVDIGKYCYRHTGTSNRLVYHNTDTHEIRWDMTINNIINTIEDEHNTD